ncbi:xylulokinase [Rhizobium sp. LEGMi135b]
MTRVLLVDLGGSSLKAGVYEVSGKAHAVVRMPNSFDEDDTGKSEQDPLEWWIALKAAADRLAAKVPHGLSGVAAVVICGFTRSQVFLDRNGDVVRPAIAFRDSRSQETARTAHSKPGVAEHASARHLTPFHPLARLLWVQQNEKPSWRALHNVVEPKDYLNFKLAGSLFSDPISQFLMRDASEGGDHSLAARAGVDRIFLPAILKPHEVVGTVLPDLPGALSQIAGAIVFCGSNDTWTAVAGLGALHHGRAYCVSGSSEVFGILSRIRAEAAGLITVPWGDALWQLGGPGQNGANVLAWIVDSLSPGNTPFDERLATLLKQQARLPLLFHPYLHGERTPFWDSNLRASFMGLGAAHKPGDLVRATMEGVGFLNRMVLERAELAAGHRIEEIRLGGGGARSAVWNQIRADILDRPVMVSQRGEMGLLGCLAVARQGLGQTGQDVQIAGSSMDGFIRYDPQPDNVDAYNKLYMAFCETHQAVADVSHRLAEISRSYSLQS